MFKIGKFLLNHSFRLPGLVTSERAFYRWKRMDSRQLMEPLDEVMTERGTPTYTRGDNGAEVVSTRRYSSSPAVSSGQWSRSLQTSRRKDDAP